MTTPVVDLEGVHLTKGFRSTLLMLDIWNAVMETGSWKVPMHPGMSTDALKRRAARAARNLGLVYRYGVVTKS